MTKHTPGPWQVCDGRHLGICVRIEGPPLEWVEDNPPAPICEMFDLNWQANAALIAAAPDLLAELQGILRCFDRDDIQPNRFDRPMGKGTRVYITYRQAERLRVAITRATT